MKTMSEIRQYNFQKIADSFKTQQTLADELDITPGYVNQLLTGHRNIGEKTARKFEKKLKLKHLALDDIDIFNGISISSEKYTQDVLESNAEYASELGPFQKIILKKYS